MATVTAKNTYHPGPRSVHTVRLAETTKDSMKQAVSAGQAETVQQWGERVIEAALGYVRCTRGNCLSKTPPIPVTFGDLTGMTFGEAVALAVEAAESQHRHHEGQSVFIGAEGRAPAPVAAKAVRFVEPKQASA